MKQNISTIIRFLFLVIFLFSTVFFVGFRSITNGNVVFSLRSQSWAKEQATILIQYEIDQTWYEESINPMTVENFLQSFHIQPSYQFEVTLPMDHLLQEKDSFRIIKVEYKNYTLQEEIPFQVFHQDIPTMEHDLIAVWIPGELGKKNVTYKEKYENGNLVSKKIVQEEITSLPVHEIIGHGTCYFEGPYKKKMRVLASSYNPTVAQCDSDPFTAASGKRVCFGMIAVDTRVIPLGTKLYVEGYGYAFAGDTGGLIKGNRIDCFLWRKLPNDNWRGGYINIYILD